MTNNANAGHKLASLLAVLVAALPVFRQNKPGTPEDDAAVAQTTAAEIAGFGFAEAWERGQRWQAEHGSSNESYLAYVESLIQEWTDQIARESAPRAGTPHQIQSVRQSHTF